MEFSINHGGGNWWRGDGGRGAGKEESHGTRVVLDWAGRRNITADHRPGSIVGLGMRFRRW